MQFEDRLVPTTLNIPTNLTGGLGSVVTAPINVDTLIDTGHGNSGLSRGVFIVAFDPGVFTVAAADVKLGTIFSNGSTAAGNGYSPLAPNGWSVATDSSNPGVLVVTLTNDGTGIITGSGGGSLVTVNFHRSKLCCHRCDQARPSRRRCPCWSSPHPRR